MQINGCTYRNRTDDIKITFIVAASALFICCDKDNIYRTVAPLSSYPRSMHFTHLYDSVLTAGRVRYLLVSPNTSLAALLGYTRFRRDELCLYKPRFRQVIGILARSTGIEPVPPRS